jgi:hypothetical protein
LAFLTEHGVPNTRIYKLHEKGTPTIVDYDAAGNPIDVVLNGVLDAHHDFDVANQVLG